MKKQKGFTLIELLIVIAVLGVLAVALLAALDPLEQIKKANDTGIRNTVTEIQAAFTRYYAVKSGVMPWGITGTLTWMSIGQGGGSAFSYLTSVIETGELKSDFATIAGSNLEKIYLTGYSTTNDSKITACYQPTSKSFKSDPNTKYGTSGAANGTIGTVSGCGLATSSCFWCVQ